MSTVLVSGAGGIVGYGVARALKAADNKLRVIGATLGEDSVAARYCDHLVTAPKTGSASYMDWLLETISEHRVDMLIPCIEADVYLWPEYAEAIDDAGAIALLNSPDLIRLCRDKWVFYEHLRDCQCSYLIPTTLSNDHDHHAAAFGLPYLLKPRIGCGSRGIGLVDGPETFRRYADLIGPQLMAQPLVGTANEEYTVAAFCNENGSPLASIAMKRTLSPAGYTQYAEVVSSTPFDAAVTELCHFLRPIGPTNFQFRLDGGAIKLLEINPRISSSTSMRATFGFNEASMSIDYFLHKHPFAMPQIRYGRAVRYIEDFVL